MIHKINNKVHDLNMKNASKYVNMLHTVTTKIRRLALSNHPASKNHWCHGL